MTGGGAADGRFAERLRVARIVHAALVGSVVVYGALVFVLKPQEQAELDPVVAWVLGAVALVLAVASMLLPAKMYGAALRSALGREDRASVRDRAPGLHFTPFILGMALAEAVALIGLVLVLAGEGLEIGLTLVGVAVLLMLPKYPSAEAIYGPLDEAARPEGRS